MKYSSVQSGREHISLEGIKTPKSCFRLRSLIHLRNSEKAQQIIQEVTSTSVGGECYFVKVDATSLRNVDQACAYIQQREPKINILFLTAGYMTVGGRDGTNLSRGRAVLPYTAIDARQKTWKGSTARCVSTTTAA